MATLARFRHHRRRRRRPRILICTPEVTELPEGMGNAAQYIRAKGGGLGDISAGLIRYLHADGRFELHVVLPQYDAKIRDLSRIGLRELDQLLRLLHNKGVHLVSDSAFSSLADVYDESDTNPRIRRAEAFQRYIINQLLARVEFDVVHCNDWMTGLVPAAARARGIKSLFTLHNVFTECQSPQNIDRSGIDIRKFVDHVYFERFPAPGSDNWSKNSVDFTATGIHAADIINTVSPTFLQEIVDGEFEGIIPTSVRHAVREKNSTGRALGILNAPGDADDPRVCPFIAQYDVGDAAEKKAVNKEQFQRAMGLRIEPDMPLFLWPSRLYTQKGPELLAAISLRCVREYGIQIALVANGDRMFEGAFARIAAASSGQVARRPFQENLSRLGMAGSDFVLMPSLYEPCGLPQMIAPRFGTLPVVRATGGLKDTVAELDEILDTGNGFVFGPHATMAFEDAIARAVRFYRGPADRRRTTIERVMREALERFTLANTAKHYIETYEALINGPVQDAAESS